MARASPASPLTSSTLPPSDSGNGAGQAAPAAAAATAPTATTASGQTPATLPRAEIFVDGTNFDIAARQLIGSSIDVPRFARDLVKCFQQPHLLVKLRYCTAPHPRPASPAGKFQAGYFAHLKQSSSVDLILGRHVHRGRYDEHGDKLYDEKETDTNVAVQMVAGAFENRYDTAVVISGDSDMVPPIKMVRDMGKHVIWCPFEHQTHEEDLRKLAHEVFELTEKFLRTRKYLVVRR